MNTIYFISHPDVIIDPSISVTDWSLSDIGSRRMGEMLRLDWIKTIGSIYCSEEKKAIDGAQILSDHLQLPFVQIKELGENDRSSTGYLPATEFESVADKFFAAPSSSIRGWETAADAQARIVGAVGDIVQSEKENTSVAVISHGAVGTLLLCHLNNWRISREHDQPGSGGGNYFSFAKETLAVNHGWIAIDAENA